MYLAGTQIEIVHPDIPRGCVRFALFDFDGTLSLIREGWQEVMISMMVDILRQTPKGRDEAQEELRRTVTEAVDRLTGRETIYHMFWLCGAIRRRGGQPLNVLEYKRIYHERLWTRIKDRLEALQTGRVEPDELMVPGARAMLEALQARGVTCFLASGTDEAHVLHEAQALRITHYFAKIYGALEDWRKYSKRIIIEHIFKENRLYGPEFVSFGDGFVEIKETKAVGGIAVGVASNEATKEGVNEWKRQRLLKAGADIIVPDFQEHEKLVGFLFGEH
ncbi:MAG: HAD hydrolase-like protein [Nitrososphaerota archaeon]